MAQITIKQVNGLQSALDGKSGTVTTVVDNYADTTDYTSGTTTQLTMTGTAPASEDDVQVWFDGLYQHHDTYTVAGLVVTFDAAIPTGVDNVEIVHKVYS